MDSRNEKYNEQLHDAGDLPKFRTARGSKVIIAPPLEYDALMKRVPRGYVVTIDAIKTALAKKYGADYACPVSSRKFVVLSAYASVGRETDETPYWRTLKKGGELNASYPEGIEGQKRLLEKEGHTIVQSGTRYYVNDYARKAFPFE